LVDGDGWPAVVEAKALPDSDLGAAALASVRRTRAGIVGRHPDGLDTCRFDPAELDDLLGITVDKLTQGELFERAGGFDAAEIAPIAARARSGLAGLGEANAAAVDKSLRLYAALRDLARERGLAGMAVRCWPEPFTEYACAVAGRWECRPRTGSPARARPTSMAPRRTCCCRRWQGSRRGWWTWSMSIR